MSDCYYVKIEYKTWNKLVGIIGLIAFTAFLLLFTLILLDNLYRFFNIQVFPDTLTGNINTFMSEFYSNSNPGFMEAIGVNIIPPTIVFLVLTIPFF